ncbi:MAG: shikimate kinase [Lachnobacterium sp.]|nr:shikimate kinase [Lachnobacterium sp.]
MKKGNNVVLIGMPGAGKSTIGVILAKVKGYNFVDPDLLIQEKEGRLLQEIIASEGIDGFIKIEEEVNASIDCQKTVIATGGSVVYGEKAMEHLREIGTVVYLKLSLDVLKNRLGDLEVRGVVLKEGQTLTDLYNERVPLYEKYADVTIDEEGQCVEQTVKSLLEILK